MSWSAAVEAARQNRNASELLRLGGCLEREGAFAAAWQLLAKGGEIKNPPMLPLWEGSWSGGSHILVRRRIRHLGAELRNARFIALAAADALKVTVATEARLVPLLQRSFPATRIVPTTELVDADSETSYERLALLYGSTEQAIAASFHPLRPRPSDSVPSGIGIAWHSTNVRKRLPTIADWAEIVRPIPGRVQSLQYDEEDAGVRDLEELASRCVVRSPVDQKEDVDGFAALVASVEGVLTISNTTAHMAGALGIPCVVVLDDLDHLMWPINQDRTPFYPSLRMIRHNGRPSVTVLQEGLIMLRNLIESTVGETAACSLVNHTGS